MMDNDLLCLLQMRVNDMTLNECPKHMEHRPNDMSHLL
jgi:hypothetical protein